MGLSGLKAVLLSLGGGVGNFPPSDPFLLDNLKLVRLISSVI